MLHQLLLLNVGPIRLNQPQGVLVVVRQQSFPDQLENRNADLIQHGFSLVSDHVPYLHGDFQTVAPTEQSEEPFNQKYLRSDLQALQMSGNLRHQVFQQMIENFPTDPNEAFLEAVHFPEESIAQDEVGKYLKCLHFSNHRRQHDGQVCHSLNVAHIRPKQMEDL